MNYKVTKNYLKTKEILIAAFTALSEAEIFISWKISQDETNRTKVLYRVYDDNELVREFNNETHLLIEPEDAETYSNAQFLFNVKIQALSSLERITVAYFSDEEDALLYVRTKCVNEQQADSLETFLIYKEQLLLRTLNRTMLDNMALKDLDSSREGSGATLSPLSRRPSPPGGPGDYWVEKNDDEQG